MKTRSGVLAVVTILFLATGAAYGQGTASEPGVARLSVIHGDVSLQRGDSGDWISATMNTPIVSGDRLSTGPGSRAELQLDYADTLRLSDQSLANVTNLDRSQIRLQLAQGLAAYSIYKGAEADTEIETPNVAVRPLGEGEFRVQVTPPDQTIVIVRKGEAEITTSDGSTRISENQMITVRGIGADAEFQTAEAPSKDQWDRFSQSRDKTISGAQSWARVGPYYTGIHDLDAYGSWVQVPGYSWAWSPSVSLDWVPYRTGRWVWEPFFGWTWVSYEPWGWAPYHYGRWFRWNTSWVWWPGPVTTRHYRPVWAPAYVSFFGFGSGNFGVSGLRVGSIGWFPVGPCDPFFPWYGASGLRFGAVDLTRFRDRSFYRNHPGAFGPLSVQFDERFSNVAMAERDDHVLRAVTSVRAEEFGRGRGISNTGISVGDFRSARMMTEALPATPTRESLAPSNRAVRESTIRNAQNVRFFGRSQTTAPSRASFDDQAARIRDALRESGGPDAGAPPSSSGILRLESRPANQPAPRNPSPQAEPNSSGQPTAPPSGRGIRVIGIGPATRAPADRPSQPDPRVIRPEQPPPNQGQDTRSTGWQRFGGPSERIERPATQPRPQGNPAVRGSAPERNRTTPNSTVRPPPNANRSEITVPPRTAPNRGSVGAGTARREDRGNPRPR